MDKNAIAGPYRFSFWESFSRVIEAIDDYAEIGLSRDEIERAKMRLAYDITQYGAWMREPDWDAYDPRVRCVRRMSRGRDFDVKTPLAAWRNYNALEMVWRDTVRLAVPRGHAGIEEMGSFYHCVRDDDAWARFSRRYAGGIIEARLDALEAGVPFDDIIS